MPRRILLVLVVASNAAFSGTQPELRPLAVTEALGMRSIPDRMPIDLSPDGRFIAFTLQDGDLKRTPSDERYRFHGPTGIFHDASGCDVLLIDTASGKTRSLAASHGSSWGPAWSPDGERLAFFSDRSGVAHLWIWEQATGELKEIAGVIPRGLYGFSVPQWSPDGARVLVKILAEGETIESAAQRFASTGRERPSPDDNELTAVVYDASTPEKAAALRRPRELSARSMDRFVSDIALVNIDSGEVRRLAHRVPAAGYWLSPDGRYAAYTTVSRMQEDAEVLLFNVVLVATATGRSRLLAEDVPLSRYGVLVSWSPNSRYIAWATGNSAPSIDGEIFVAEAARADLVPRRALKPRGSRLRANKDDRAPLWDSSSENLFIADGSDLWRIPIGTLHAEKVVSLARHRITDIVAAANNRGPAWSAGHLRTVHLAAIDQVTRKASFWRVDVRSRETEVVYEKAMNLGGDLRNLVYTVDTSRDNTAVAYMAESASQAPAIWVADKTFRAPRRLTGFNPEIDAIAFGASQLISWKGTDGTALNGALFLPAGYVPGRRYPLVAWVYGGAMGSNDVHRFGGRGTAWNLHLLTTRGYAVLLPDIPTHVGTTLKNMADAVLPGLTAVIDLGIADPERIGVGGYSYGGYTTLSLIVQSQRFKAAVAGAGASNLLSGYGQLRSAWRNRGPIDSSWAEAAQGKMGGHPWAFPNRYMANSPITYLDRVATPLLLLQGGEDEATYPTQSEEVLVGLHRLGKPVVYVRYEDEHHGVDGWRMANRIDLWNRTIGWFDRFLKPTASTKPSGAE